MLNDLSLAACYILLMAVMAILDGRRSEIALICIVALIVFVVAHLGILLDMEPHWYHAILMVVCLAWAALVITVTGAVWCAVTIVALAAFQIILAIDARLYPVIETAVSSKRVVIATGIHLLILLTAYDYGRPALSTASRGDAVRGDIN